MVPLRWRFVIPALLSILLGARELFAAWIVFQGPHEQLLQYMTPEGLLAAQFEILFLLSGGFFLIMWPIAYRLNVIRKWS